jgi:hypothetical protein
MDSLTDYLPVIKQIIAEYAKPPVNGYAYFTESPDGQLFTVVDVYEIQGKRQASTGLIVHIAQEHIVIERDLNNKPLVDVLVQQGIPRQRIILAYAGERTPEVASTTSHSGEAAQL